MIEFINTGVTRLQNLFLRTEVQLSPLLKAVVMVCTCIIYVVIFIFLRDLLTVSINFFVLIPMFVAASLYQFWGGIISGTLALPFNLFILWLLDDMSYSPASKIITFIFGIGTGAALGFLSSFYVRLRQEIAEHKKAQTILDKTLSQKKLLLKESHHRIKNNLTIIMGIIEFELLEETDQRQEVFLQNLIDRIRSVSITQNLLYSIEDIEKIEMHQFISKLIDQISLSVAIQEQGIQFILNIDKLELNIDKALPIGLIINETCTNSIKYAFYKIENPRIEITLKKENGSFFLTLKDNGQGLPQEVLEGGSESVGLNLIEKMVQQMNANLKLQNDNGAVLEVYLPPETSSDSPERQKENNSVH